MAPTNNVSAASWLARARAAGIQIKESIELVRSRYATAIEPDEIVKWTSFENIGNSAFN
jgi:hypothetical protein